MRSALGGFLLGVLCALVIGGLTFWIWRAHARAHARLTPLAVIAAETLAVPRGSELGQPTLPSGWQGHTLQVHVLQDVTDLIGPSEFLPARAYLAWNETHFLARVEVDSLTLEEAAKDENIDQGDGVQLSLFTGDGENHRISIIVSPGLDPKHPQPRVKVPSGPPYDPAAKEVLQRVERTEKGYAVTFSVPWARLGGPRRLKDSVGVQVMVNHLSDKVLRHYAWFPHAETGTDSRRAVMLVLAEKPSKPITSLARIVVLTPHAAQATFTFEPTPDTDHREHLLFVRHKEDTLARYHFSNHITSFARIFDLPEGWGVATPVTAWDGKRLLATLTQNATITQLERLTENIAFNFQPSVFYSANFPNGTFAQDAIIRHAYAPVQVKTTFYNSLYEPVTKADLPGRYGAVVDITMGGGLKVQKFITLYRAPAKFPWGGKFPVTGVLPPNFGMNPEVMHAQEAQIDAVFGKTFLDSFTTSNTAAVLLAGLAGTTSGSAPAVKRVDAFAKDAEWWYALRARLALPKTYDYNVALPAGYGDDKTKKWPVILFLHGVGKRDSLQVVKEPGLPSVMGLDRKLPAIVVSPQCPNGDWWSPLILGHLLEEVATKYAVDSERIYVTGLSMGGFGTWSLALAYPERFAAVAPLCGGGDPDDAARLTKLPVWAFHGGKDPVVPTNFSVDMVKAINKAGGHAHLTIYPDQGHECWYSAYRNDDLYTWLLAQKRGQPEVTVPGIPKP